MLAEKIDKYRVMSGFSTAYGWSDLLMELVVNVWQGSCIRVLRLFG